MKRAIAIWMVGAVLAMVLAHCSQREACDHEFASGVKRPTPKRACEMIDELCPKRTAPIDGKTCEEQVAESTPPFGSIQNKTTHNVLNGYGKNPDCIATVYYSQQCQRAPFARGCEMLKHSCECGKLYGLAHYPYPPNPGDTECNPRLP